MSAQDHLGQQFPDLDKAAWHERGTHAVVPIEALHDAYSWEFDVPGRYVAQGHHMRLRESEEYHNPNDKPEAVDKLTESVRQHGIQTPLKMRWHPEDHVSPHSIVDGSHRLLAAQRAGLTMIPVRYH